MKFLDQLRAMLIETYGDEITALLQETSQPHEPKGEFGDDNAF